MNKVFVGLSGGVDSSVTATLLKQAGYDVVGVYMKNWSRSLPGFKCPWREDYQDAKRVAVQLGIPFEMFDFEEEYQQKVVDYMIEEYKLGRTPNPDIMCNQEIKFKLFLDTALDQGADYVATGHYARTDQGLLYRPEDKTKDQTYFLYRVSSSAFTNTLFPLGGLLKTKVREIAKEQKLVTADKKESMGICFIGQVGIKEFLSQYVTQEIGQIIDTSGQVVGEHDGAIFYTIGQRHGLNLGGGLPYYVVDKDIDSNTIYVSRKLDDERLWSDSIKFTRPHWIEDSPTVGKEYEVRLRHLGPMLKGTFNDDLTVFKLKDPVKAANPGQSLVVYDNDLVLGGAIIRS